MGLLLFPESGQNRLLQWALKPRLKLYQWRLFILKILGSAGCIPPATIDRIRQRCVLRGRIPHLIPEFQLPRFRWQGLFREKCFKINRVKTVGRL